MSAAFDASRLERLREAIEEDIAHKRYHGASLVVARHGEVGLEATIGCAYANQRQPLAKDAVFSLFSVTKAFTNILVLRAIELGHFALTTRVSEVIPEFSGGPRENLTVYHLMTHRTGLPPIFSPKPGMYLDRLEEVLEAIVMHVQADEEAGIRVNYSPMVAHVLLGEMLRRTDPRKRRYRDIVHQDLFEPLRMLSSSIGLRADLRPRKIVPDFLPTRAPMQHLGHSNYAENGAFEEEDAEMPWVGAVSTAADMHRFTEMLRRGGELGGARIISPATLRR